MKIYFVRHGHPDYANDCLTPLGHKQAAAAAERLRDSGISAVYSSTKGRALQTAEYTASLLGLTVNRCDFMREIGWASIDDEPILAGGHPWQVSSLSVLEGRSLADPDWKQKTPYNHSRLIRSCEVVEGGIDAWLESLGYRREGDYYRVCAGDTNRTVAMFSHGGASAMALAHLMNIPFPQMCGMFHIDFTSIVLLELGNAEGTLVRPVVKLFNDARHIEGITVDNVYSD